MSTVRPDLGPNGMKRKAGEDLYRPKKAQETGKLSLTTSTAKLAPTIAPGPAKAPKKGSYQDLLNRAKALTTTQKAPVGAIVNKPKTPVDKPLKEWQKKFQEERAAKAGGGRTSKSPGTTPTGEKPAVKGVEKSGILPKKTGADTMGSLKRGAPGAVDRKVSVSGTSSSKAKASIVEPKPRPSVSIKERDRDRSPPKKSSRDDYPSKSKSSVYDRPKPRQQYVSISQLPSTYLVNICISLLKFHSRGRYIYKEDSTDYSDSDMEATGMDILEEEELSAKRARLEDLEQERLEKKLAAEKKARKRTSTG